MSMKPLVVLAATILIGVGGAVAQGYPSSSDASVVARNFDHLFGIDLVVRYQGERTFKLTANCTACVVDAHVEQWISSDPREREPLPGVLFTLLGDSGPGLGDDIDVGPISIEPGVPFAIDFVVSVGRGSAALVERRVSVFGLFGDDGTLEPLDWRTWVCGSGTAHCGYDEDGEWEIILYQRSGGFEP